MAAAVESLAAVSFLPISSKQNAAFAAGKNGATVRISQSKPKCLTVTASFPANGASSLHSQSSLSQLPGSSLNGPRVSYGIVRPSRSESSTWVTYSTEAGGGGGADDGVGGNGGNGSGGGGGGESWGSDDAEKIKAESLAKLAALGKLLENLPKDLAEAVMLGKIPVEIVTRYFSLMEHPLLRNLMKFDGFKERLLADDLFLTKVGIECGVGIFTKTAAEYEKRRENFYKEIDYVVADVIMALIADFMLVWLPAPTVALRPSLSVNANKFARFFSNCPDNAFQVALRGTSYTLLQRFGAIARNGGKLLAVGTVASLFGTAMTNGLTLVRTKLIKSSPAAASVKEEESVKVPILATSVAYGVYMAISSNLRYQILAGVIEQRLLEPSLHNKKVLLSVLSFIVRTGNTFLGSLLWVDYARFVGVQEGH